MQKKFDLFTRKASLNDQNFVYYLTRTYSDYKNFVENNKEIDLLQSSKHCLAIEGKNFNLFFAYKSGIYLLDPLTSEKENIYMLDIDFSEIRDYLYSSIHLFKKSDRNSASKLLNRKNLLIKTFSTYLSTYCEHNKIKYLLTQTDNGLHLYIINLEKHSSSNQEFIKYYSKAVNDKEKFARFIKNKDLKLFYELYCDPSCACNLLPHYRDINKKKRLVAKQLYAVRASQKLFIPFENKGYSTKFTNTSSIINSIVEKELKNNLTNDSQLLKFYNYLKNQLFHNIEKIKKLNSFHLVNSDSRDLYKKNIRSLKTNYNRPGFSKSDALSYIRSIFRKANLKL